MQMRLFDELCIETQSTCNRKCPTCERQTWPDQSALTGRRRVNRMPEPMVHDILRQAASMGFRGRVCLQHFNEPLQDTRLAELARMARSVGAFAEVYANTNGDLLTPTKAAELDGAIDRLHIALYDGNKNERAMRYLSYFKHTQLTFTGGEHVITHNSPMLGLTDAIGQCRSSPCEYECQARCIISYTGEMLMCCDDIAGAWQLGNVGVTPLKSLWYGDRHSSVVKALACAGGREQYPLCRMCPRPSQAHWSVQA